MELKMNLPEETLQCLKPHAMDAACRSYSPYSRFPVGAAVVDEAGRIHAGCNVENASLGLTQCAERNALAAAIAAGATPGRLRTLLIYTPGSQAHVPCGACRQVMHELMAADSLVVSCCDGEAIRSWRREDYLPDPFTPDSLTRDTAGER
jgi:cytidine deaminase